MQGWAPDLFVPVSLTSSLLSDDRMRNWDVLFFSGTDHEQLLSTFTLYILVIYLQEQAIQSNVQHIESSMRPSSALLVWQIKEVRGHSTMATSVSPYNDNVQGRYTRV